MKRWIWIVAALAISTGVYFTIRYGLRPKPIPVLDPTEFTELDQAGAVIYKRLRHDVRAERVVLLGSSQELRDFEKLWSGFIKAALADKEKIVLFTRAGLPPLEGPWESEIFDETAVHNGEMEHKIRDRVKAGQLILIHGLTKEVSHLVSGSLSRLLDPVLQHPVLSLSSLHFALKQEDWESLHTQCLESEDTEFRLACAAQRVARKYARKGLDQNKIWAVMERHGLKEYLVFIYQP